MLHSQPTRRGAMKTAGVLLASAVAGRASGATAAAKFQVHEWKKDDKNPVLPPTKDGDFDAGCCMNPFALRQGDEYYLFYSGAQKSGRRRICLATAPVNDLHNWTRHGPLFETGPKGSFDETWCVLPCVHKIGGRWHMYWTGRSAQGGGLQAFNGIGLATSDDLKTWKKSSDEPILKGDGYEEWPKNRGIAGGGRILEFPGENGKTIYRMYYTLATGTPSKMLTVDQAKQSVCADSTDGLTWTNRKVLLKPRPDVPYENAGVIALNVWKTKTRYLHHVEVVAQRAGNLNRLAECDPGLVGLVLLLERQAARPPAPGGGLFTAGASHHGFRRLDQAEHLFEPPRVGGRGRHTEQFVGQRVVHQLGLLVQKLVPRRGILRRQECSGQVRLCRGVPNHFPGPSLAGQFDHPLELAQHRVRLIRLRVLAVEFDREPDHRRVALHLDVADCQAFQRDRPRLGEEAGHRLPPPLEVGGFGRIVAHERVEVLGRVRGEEAFNGLEGIGRIIRGLNRGCENKDRG
jgi:hypothetical protein